MEVFSDGGSIPPASTKVDFCFLLGRMTNLEHGKTEVITRKSIKINMNLIHKLNQT